MLLFFTICSIIFLSCGYNHGIGAEFVQDVFIKNQDGNFLGIHGPSIRDYKGNGILDHEGCNTRHYDLRALQPCNYITKWHQPAIFKYNPKSGQIIPKFGGRLVQDLGDDVACRLENGIFELEERIHPGSECNVSELDAYYRKSYNRPAINLMAVNSNWSHDGIMIKSEGTDEYLMKTDIFISGTSNREARRFKDDNVQFFLATEECYNKRRQLDNATKDDLDHYATFYISPDIPKCHEEEMTLESQVPDKCLRWPDKHLIPLSTDPERRKMWEQKYLELNDSNEVVDDVLIHLAHSDEKRLVINSTRNPFGPGMKSASKNICEKFSGLQGNGGLYGRNKQLENKVLDSNKTVQWYPLELETEDCVSDHTRKFKYHQGKLVLKAGAIKHFMDGLWIESIEARKDEDKNTTCNVEDLPSHDKVRIYDDWDRSEIAFEIVWLACNHVQLKYLPEQQQQPEWVYLTNYGGQLRLATEKEFDQKREDYQKKVKDDNLVHDFGYFTSFELYRESRMSRFSGDTAFKSCDYYDYYY